MVSPFPFLFPFKLISPKAVAHSISLAASYDTAFWVKSMFLGAFYNGDYGGDWRYD